MGLSCSECGAPAVMAWGTSWGTTQHACREHGPAWLDREFALPEGAWMRALPLPVFGPPPAPTTSQAVTAFPARSWDGGW